MKPRTRKEEYAEMTRQALMDSAWDLFLKQGYHGTSIDTIVQQARVTKGAFYHHFKSKEEVFVLVYSYLVEQLVSVVEKDIAGIEDCLERAVAGCRSFLDYCINPKYRSIRLDDAIGVLGWKKWREIDSSFTMKILKEIVQEMSDSGEFYVASVEYTANLIYAMLVEAALTLADASNRRDSYRQILEVIQRMLTALKQ